MTFDPICFIKSEMSFYSSSTQIPTLPTWVNNGTTAEFDRKVTPGGKNRLKKVSAFNEQHQGVTLSPKDLKISLAPEFAEAEDNLSILFIQSNKAHHKSHPSAFSLAGAASRHNILRRCSKESKLSWKISLHSTDKLFQRAAFLLQAIRSAPRQL